MALVIGLTSSIVAIVYICLLPLILQTYTPAWICWHLTYGHWNLIMIVFHYYMAITTSPGHPPQVRHQVAAELLPAGHWGPATQMVTGNSLVMLQDASELGKTGQGRVGRQRGGTGESRSVRCRV